jgi:hypothetical protein
MGPAREFEELSRRGRMVARTGLTELLQGPLRGRVSGHVVVENSSCSHIDDHEYVKGAESRRDHDEEVARHDYFGVIPDEGQPALFRIRLSSRTSAVYVFPDGPG